MPPNGVPDSSSQKAKGSYLLFTICTCYSSPWTVNLYQKGSSEGLGISVTEASLDEILITAPLAPNLNHHGTAFGGSVSAVAILSGWALVYARLEAEGKFPGVVIQYNAIRYLKPVEDVFAARARLAHPGKWTHFMQGLSRHGKARTIVTVDVEGRGCGIAAVFQGTYVALRDDALIARNRI
jgi:thioesterase domain-containing protein